MLGVRTSSGAKANVFSKALIENTDSVYFNRLRGKGEGSDDAAERVVVSNLIKDWFGMNSHVHETPIMQPLQILHAPSRALTTIFRWKY